MKYNYKFNRLLEKYLQIKLNTSKLYCCYIQFYDTTFYQPTFHVFKIFKSELIISTYKFFFKTFVHTLLLPICYYSIESILWWPCISMLSQVFSADFFCETEYLREPARTKRVSSGAKCPLRFLSKV